MNFDLELTAHEMARRAAMVGAIDWEPEQVLADEQQAWRMLYSDLDEVQQKVFDELVKAGVLPAD